jgi:hypothetical protein
VQIEESIHLANDRIEYIEELLGKLISSSNLWIGRLVEKKCVLEQHLGYIQAVIDDPDDEDGKRYIRDIQSVNFEDIAVPSGRDVPMLNVEDRRRIMEILGDFEVEEHVEKRKIERVVQRKITDFVVKETKMDEEASSEDDDEGFECLLEDHEKEAIKRVKVTEDVIDLSKEEDEEDLQHPYQRKLSFSFPAFQNFQSFSDDVVRVRAPMLKALVRNKDIFKKNSDLELNAITKNSFALLDQRKVSKSCSAICFDWESKQIFSAESHKVLKYSAKLADVKVAITENNLSIRDIAISNHHLFVLHEQQVRVFSLDGDFIRSFESKSSKAGNLILAARFAIDEDGDIFVTDSDTNMVHIFSNDGEFLMLFGDSPVTVLDCPQFICARDSFVYVSDKGNSRITIFDRSGQLIQQSFVEDIVPNSSGLIVSEISGLYLLGEFLYLTFASQNAIVAVSRKTLSFDSCFRWKEDISESDDSAIISISIDSLNYLLYILDTREQYIKVYQETIFCSKSSM